MKPYLTLPDDAQSFGVPDATPAQAMQATTVINATIQRPEGIIWLPDGAGNPAYMDGSDPIFTFNAAAPVSPGSNVVLTVTGAPTGSSDLIGEVVILDRAQPTLVEACVITATAPGSITLAKVLFSHAAPLKLETGLVIREERTVVRSLTRVSRGPLIAVLSALGRYGPGRRSEQYTSDYIEEFSLLAGANVFGGPPMWSPIDLTQISISPTTLELWLPAGLLMAYYTDAKLFYVAGYPTVPWNVKQACANIIRAYKDTPTTPIIRSFRTGGTSVDRFAASVLDDQTKALLEPYRAKLFR